jgi:hypothetical protein
MNSITGELLTSFSSLEFNCSLVSTAAGVPCAAAVVAAGVVVAGAVLLD